MGFSIASGEVVKRWVMIGYAYSWWRMFWSLEAFRFIVIGSFTVVLNYLIFVALYEIGIPYVDALWIAFAITFVLGFFLHKSQTFRHNGRDWLLFRFVLYGAKQIALTEMDAILLVWCVESVHLPPWFAQGVLTGVISFFSYFLSRWIFKRSKQLRK